MTDKKTQKEINAILKKYTGASNRQVALIPLSAAGALISFAALVDFSLTGGIGMGVAIAALGGAPLASMSIVNTKKYTEKNTAEQLIETQSLSRLTLNGMEKILQNAFLKANNKNALPADKESFRQLTAEIEQDVKKLSPAFKIVSGGPNGFGTEKYEFMIKKPDSEKPVTLAQALHDLESPEPQKSIVPQPTTQDVKIKELEARLAELENPHPVTLAKKRIDPRI